MDHPTHIVFTPSGEHALRQALASEGGENRIFCLRDDFSSGPIGRTPRERSAWSERTRRPTEWRQVVDESGAFLAAVAAAKGPLVAWFSRADSFTYAGFLWWLAQTERADVLLADAATLRVANASQVLDQCRCAVPISVGQRHVWQRRWRELETENAPLRVIAGGDMVSASIDHFDADLLGCASAHWQKMARIIGQVFDGFARCGICQTSDAVLAGRLVALVHKGELAARGDLADMVKCELRLPIR